MDKNSKLPTLEFILKNYQNFNSRATKDALVAYWRLLEKGGKMFWAIAGAMSSAQLGISLAPAIREGIIHGISSTGANIEESLFRLVADKSYKDFPNYRYLTREDDTEIKKAKVHRITDTSVPEDEAFQKMEDFIVPMFEKASKDGERKLWHEYFYDVVKEVVKKKTEGDPADCWLLAAAEKNLCIVVPGYEDSTFGNLFASKVAKEEVEPFIVKSGVEYFTYLYDQYRKLSKGAGIGFFQIGGGIAGDFPICVVPSLRYDMEETVKDWAYFCQISDSTTSYGSYSGATPNEKITWDKVNKDTPMFVVESDATIVVPLILQALLEMKQNPKEANAMLADVQVEKFDNLRKKVKDIVKEK